MSKRPGWIQSVQEMLREGLAVPDTELYEDTPGRTCRRVKIHRSGKSLIISFNATISFTSKGERVCVKDRLFPLFREQEGVARMSDYWILWETGDETPTLHTCSSASSSRGNPTASLRSRTPGSSLTTW